MRGRVTCHSLSDEDAARRPARDIESSGPVHATPATIQQAVRLAVGQGDRSLSARRRVFLRRCWPYLGPTQRRHVADHCWAVRTIALRLGARVGLSGTAVDHLGRAALFHDIGKCRIPEWILDKSSALTADERAVIGRHAAIGASIATALGAPGPVVRMIACHHRRADGPADPLAPAATTVLTVADALAGMMSDRPYHPARTARQALAELRREAGTVFDATVVDAADAVCRGSRRVA
ncbi:MAG: HD-GYP domain-containing protein [Planctomycetota bacterium]